MLGSYGSLARYRDFSRVSKVNNSTVIGCGGDIADFQFLKSIIEQRVWVFIQPWAHWIRSFLCFCFFRFHSGSPLERVSVSCQWRLFFLSVSALVLDFHHHNTAINVLSDPLKQIASSSYCIEVMNTDLQVYLLSLINTLKNQMTLT